jgi:Rad3-related DNA helicase
MTCEDMKRLERPPCKGCDYARCRRLAIKSEPTFFNPISYYYASLDPRFKAPKVLIVDEAHRLTEMALLLCGIRLRRGQYDYPKLNNEVEAVEWIKTKVETLQKLVTGYLKQGNTVKANKTSSDIERLETVKTGLEREPQNFVMYTESRPYRGHADEYLNIVPLDAPKFILDQMLKCEKLILMSATLPVTDVRSLARGQKHLYLDMPSPIPVENRPILFRPAPEMNWRTPPENIATWVKAQLQEFPDRNTVIHVSYELANKLRPYLPGVMTNTPETKDKVLEQFKRDGGVWLASGCAEGIDLPNDECRLTIIPMLTRLNIMAAEVKKRLAREYGQLWYDMETLKTVIQQAGRSTRGIDDHSITVIGDPKFAQLITKNSRHVPMSFKEAIQWRKNQKTG